VRTRFDPAGPLRGTVEPPPDKSISHRAALVAAMSEDWTRVRSFLRSEDTGAMLAAIHALGAQIEPESERRSGGDLSIRGVGLRGARAPSEPIDAGNAGTLLRLLPGWLAGQRSGRWTLDGDESIRRRPVDRIAQPLRAMGARVECRDGRLPPLVVEGGELRGIRYELPVASAQVKSCLLLAGLLAGGPTTIVEPLATRDHTELMLREAGAEVTVERRDGVATVEVQPVRWLRIDEIRVPGDFSSAAFLLVAALIVPGSEVSLRAVGVNPTRTGLLTILDRMGAEVEVEPRGGEGGEPIADVHVRHAELRGASVGPGEVPLAIDELPLIALLGAFAEGTTTVRGAEELRHKESDRIATVVEGLRALGAEIEATADGFTVEGTGGLRGGALDAHGDHRLAMLGAVAGVASRDGVEVEGFEAAAVSYRTFAEELASVFR
jgi:3-phosphoshikimate 1-carboxyvinyltransferase